MQECCEIIGHHGTTQDIAKKIMETSFLSDPRKIGWLGTGNYFYDDDPLMAKKYSLKRFKHSISCVLECRIVIPKELEFDVTDPKSDDTSLFHKTRKKLIEELIKKNRLNLTTRNSNDFDGKIYNFICNKKGYQLIRACTFSPPKNEQDLRVPISRVPNGIELCLKHGSYVKDKHIIEVDEEATS